ncbi:hypothetical protein FCIRC_7915 [Fusarium circinatum]|uniref:Uncharacterized protein n=1 Tax=Fusarium circinatum TaxID=48490 RepID=A0A8H5WSK5_FUSCI|nr:hypothetical protein FCIRC_7915 [Fusarium circinatum]
MLLFINGAAGRERIVKAWLKTLRFRSSVPWFYLLPKRLAKRELRNYSRPLDSCDEVEDGETRGDQRATSISNWNPRPTSGKHHLPIYRQRARALFDDNRLYPRHGNHFSTSAELAGTMKELKKTLAPNVERSRKRSQKWQDYWALRTLEPPEQQRDKEDDKVSIKGHVGTCPSSEVPHRDMYSITT